jgi:hypothetical protein
MMKSPLAACASLYMAVVARASRVARASDRVDSLSGRILLVVAVGLFLAVSGSACGPEAREGRISVFAVVVRACPLAKWRLGGEDGCDALKAGTRVEIHRRNIHPEYPDGPFALVEYRHEGTQKLQYVKDIYVVPLEEDGLWSGNGIGG